MLRRPGDKALLDRLSGQMNALIDQVRVGLPTKQYRFEVRKAARACIGILRTAKQERLSRAQSEAQARQQGAGKPGRPAAHAHHPAGRRRAVKARRKPISGAVIAAGATTVAGLAAVVVVIGIVRHSGNDASPSGLATQIQDAVHGATPAINLYGGTLKIETVNGHQMVTASGIPPAACIDVGWQLMRKGIVAINGEAPRIVSAAKLGELCHRNEAGANVSWIPSD